MGSLHGERLQDPRSFLENVHPDDHERVGIALRTFNVGDYDVTYRTLGTDGEVQWIWTRAYPVRDAKGDIYRIAGIAEDITTQKVAEEQRETAPLESNVTFSRSSGHPRHTRPAD